MAVRWGCPECGANEIEEDPFAEALRCGRCGEVIPRRAALCVACDAPGALHPRDTIHVECRRCGERQMIFAPLLVPA